ncbi:tight adherence pilus pseudopilin TadF [Vibrio sp. F74]|uniref:tight adherence pilus pseudopilin TadF n=1 Tax=Vibrio sp. F74 TaxID=700020 RepID=UPI0035F54A5B
MKELCLRSKQKGTFAVEFAIVGVIFAVFLAFTSDVVTKIAMKGKLDRLSFSAVSIVKERTQLYTKANVVDYTMSSSEVADIYKVLKRSMKRTTSSFSASKFGMVLEEQTYGLNGSRNALATFNRGTNRCQISNNLSSLEQNLAVTTTWGRKSTLYRVTLCYETDNGVAGMLSNGFTTVTSSSVILGR